MISIVVPAHNESLVIARTLGEWVNSPDFDANEIDIVVVCNGCTDNTANIARRFGRAVRVIETDVAGKTHALNLGDQASRFFPRIYVDADIIIALDGLRALASRLDRGDVLAVAPAPDIDLTGCSWLVCEYYGVRMRLPSSREGIGGSGVYALSDAGRRRFGQFPDIIADDTYVRVQFKPEERATLVSTKSTVFPPRTMRELISIRTRGYAGTFELANRYPELFSNRGDTNNQALSKLFRQPRLWLGLFVYCFVTAFARYRATVRYRARASVWQRDDTSRVALSTDTPK